MSKKTKKAVSPLRKKQNRFIVISALVLVVIITFANVKGLVNSYYDSFIRVGDEAAEAASYLVGLSVTETEELAQLRADWDSWRYSRLMDHVTITAGDGTTLHGYFYNEGSGVTAIAVPRFQMDGTGDFLLGPWLNEQTGCNILMIDPRAHGASGGDSFSYGYQEAADLICWMDWADETLGEQSFLLWGEASGANTILFAAADGRLEGRVAFAVAESPYASFRELADYSLQRNYRLPGAPFRTLMEWKLNQDDLGFRADDMELADSLKGSGANVPVLFLQSAEDEYILPDWSRSVYDAYPGDKELISGGTGHGTVYTACREEILALVESGLLN